MIQVQSQQFFAKMMAEKYNNKLKETGVMIMVKWSACSPSFWWRKFKVNNKMRSEK